MTKCAIHGDNDDKGFTLLEVLVALAILSMSLSVLMGVFAVALSRTAEARQRAAALNLAQELLVRAETAAPSDLKDKQGVTQNGFSWRIHLQDYGSTQDATNWQSGAVEISSSVFWTDHKSPHHITLMTLRLLPKASANG